MPLIQIFILAIIQGAAELLPVSSSAHVILAEKLMGLDPSAPEMTFLLVMLHCGTMFAVLLYFWKRWIKLDFHFFKMTFLATVCTGFVGLGLKKIIEHIMIWTFTQSQTTPPQRPEIEHLFKNLPLISFALFSVGIFMIYADSKKKRFRPILPNQISPKAAMIIGSVQGLCLPFRGFSRSGATLSTALLLNVSKESAENFSFALAVILTPPVILLELYRLLKSAGIAVHSESTFATIPLVDILIPGFLGMIFSFCSGLVALRWLSAWFERGHWKYCGIYCILFSGVVLGAHFILR